MKADLLRFRLTPVCISAGLRRKWRAAALRRLLIEALVIASSFSLFTSSLNAQQGSLGALSVTNIGPAATNFLEAAGSGWNFTGRGSGAQGTSDALALAYEWRTGDFDVALRVAEFVATNVWAQAGLMARDGFNTNATFASTLATPGQAGCHFAWRVSSTANAQIAGNFPANGSDTWLRLRRTGNLFEGFAGFDGQSWQLLGSATISMPAAVPVGLVVSGGQADAVAHAQFRDIAPASGAIVASVAIPFEPLGPCSRRTSLVISEIMYNPPAWLAPGNLQFVEIYNSGIAPEDLTGHRLGGDVSFSFPAGTILAPGAFLVISKNPAALQSFYGINSLGPFNGNLPNSSGTVYLLSEIGSRLLEIEYDSRDPWPVAADGTGHSLVLRWPSYGENDSRAWSASDQVGGSPGRPEHYGAEPGRAVVINEVLAHTDLPQLDFVELYNHSNVAVDLSECTLSDSPDTNRYTFPANTVVPARGYLVLNETQLGFALRAAGEKIILRNASQTRVLDAVAFGPQENGVSFGRWPNGASDWHRLAAPTPGAPNADVRLEPVVINELMYAPITELDEDQYLELHNRGSVAIDISGWKIAEGIRFTFPSNTTLSAGGFIVVAKNVNRLLTNYPHLGVTNALGNFSGRLSGKGERVVLTKPDIIVTTNQAQLVTNLMDIAVDEVRYAQGGGDWPQYAHKGGSSLERIDSRANRRLASNWAASDETAKAPWTAVDLTAIVENGMAVPSQGANQGTPNRFEFFLQGPGEALLDSLELRNNGGPNLIGNPGFETGTNGFTLGGTQRRSFVQSGMGVGGSAALRLVSTGRGDTGPNKAWAQVTTLATGTPNTGTIRAQARWLKGSPRLHFRVRGNWLEAPVQLQVPANLGTPGLPNTRAMTNAGPAIYNVQHTPVLPAAGQAVVVTAIGQDPDGLGSVTLRYRIDPGTTLVSVAMRDDGTGGDAIAGDGIFSGTIPAQSAGVMAAFHIVASDFTSPARTNTFPANAPSRECLVRWGESPVPGTLGTYRIWLTQAAVDFWTAREKNANDDLACTFVYGNSRAIYNAGARYSGSPITSVNNTGPLGSRCKYQVTFPPDDKLLGHEEFVLNYIDSSGGGLDKTAQLEITELWIARKLGLPWNHRRHVHLYVNGQRRFTIYEDAQQPNGEWMEGFFPGQDGPFHKVDDWFEFANDGQTYSRIYGTIEKFEKTGGGTDVKRYRWNWRPRATTNPENWTEFVALVEAMNTPGSGADYLNAVRFAVDPRGWLGPVAVNHICGVWDTYGYERGKNQFVYRSADRGWVGFLWDMELGLGLGKPATDNIYLCIDPVLTKMMQNTPAFNREYLGLMLDAVNGPLAPGAADGLMDARYAALTRNGLAVNSPSGLKSYIANRRSYLLTQIPQAPFAAAAPGTTDVAQITLSGTAPVNVRTIAANGRRLAPSWSTATSWASGFFVSPGTNVIQVVGYDAWSNVVGTATVTVVFTGSSAWPALRINEWMASNAGVVRDPADNDADDWFEIYNPTDSDVNLHNWTLTDTLSNPTRFVVPSGYTVPSNGFLLVWADNETHQNTVSNRPHLHVNFALERSGESIAIYAPDGTAVDAVTFGPQQTDVSEGRYPDGLPFVSRLQLPTPGAPNLPVFPPPVSVSARLTAAGALEITFATKPGLRYQLEWRERLEEGIWSAYEPPVMATETSLAFDVPVVQEAQRFYRVLQLP